ncbi:hypothetical protein [Nocardia vaccinii]|uniref:hypothetical protein n=1 Tax=Nocardia vaccinii TaxID=1822 RepID=UPI000AE14C5E|nr:hypothetical protein [Nocardia vaccinii]
MVVVLDAKFGVAEVPEFRLGAHAREYRRHRMHRDKSVHLEDVVVGEILFEDLVR